MSTEDMLVFGDSIAYGAWDPEGGWQGRLYKFLERKRMHFKDSNEHYLIYNLGVDADNTDKLLKRFRAEAKIRFYFDDKYAIIFSIGGNDSCYLKNPKRHLVPEKRFKKNIKELITMAKSLKPNVAHIVFLGITPCDENQTQPFDYTAESGLFIANKDRKRYDSIIREVCREEKAKFIEIFGAFLEFGYEKKLLLDGLHPNSKGHEKLFEIIYKELKKMKIVE